MASIAITVPPLGGTVTEATFIAWLKQDGDPVAAGEPVAEVMTEKVNVEIESPAAGRLTGLRAQPDEMVAVGAVIALIEAAS